MEYNVDVEVHRMHKLQNSRYLKAFVDIVINKVLLIKGLKVINGKEGLFMSMPQEQSKDDKWYDSVRCLDDKVKDLISREVLHAYEAEDYLVAQG